jgi:hypothetical protein
LPAARVSDTEVRAIGSVQGGTLRVYSCRT